MSDTISGVLHPTLTDMYKYGYNWIGMCPIPLEHYLCCNKQVYLLYEDGTESTCDDLEEATKHVMIGGMLGVELDSIVMDRMLDKCQEVLDAENRL